MSDVKFVSESPLPLRASRARATSLSARPMRGLPRLLNVADIKGPPWRIGASRGLLPRVSSGEG
jgi:hypothetical protein